MTRALLSTQVAVTLSLNVVTRSGNDTQLMALPLLTLTPILFLVYALLQWVNRQWYGLATLAMDFREAFTFTATVFTIGLSSLAWGMGVRV